MGLQTRKPSPSLWEASQGRCLFVHEAISRLRLHGLVGGRGYFLEISQVTVTITDLPKVVS